jgi:hypothetical protein
MFAGYGMQKYAGGWILHPNSPAPRRVDAGLSMHWSSVSPDGRWVAFGHHLSHVNVYEAGTGRRVWQSPDDGHDFCRFSPDGRWLVTAVDGVRLYAVGTWEPGPQLGPGTPWDVTDDLAVVGQTDGIYRLVELATGRELARLEDPERNTGPAAFTPDGTKLVVVAKNGLRVWDLRRIRQQLAKLSLDWDAPAYPPAEDEKSLAPVKVEVIREPVAEALSKATADLALAPDDARANNNLAWLLATCPDATLRDPARAVRLAAKAVKLAPKMATYWNTLGAAHYRAADYKIAIDNLKKSTDLQGENAVDAFFLAMAQWQLGQKTEAHKHFDQAVRWMKEHEAALKINRHDAEELRRFRAEATELLQRKDKSQQ